MKIKFLYLFAILIFVFFSSVFGKDSKLPKSTFSKKDIVEFFKKSYFLKNDEKKTRVYMSLYKSILNNYSKYQYGIVDSVIIKEELVSYKWFVQDVDEKSLYYPDKHYLNISILLNGITSTIYDCDIKSNHSLKIEQLGRYYYDNSNKPYISDSISLIGEINIYDNVFTLDIDLEFIEKDNVVSVFDSFFFCLEQIFNFVNLERERLSYFYFNQCFNTLTFEEQKAIIKICPLKILIRDSAYPIINPPREE